MKLSYFTHSASVLILPLIIILSLEQLANTPNKHKNGFTRSWVARQPLSPLHTASTKESLVQIAGTSSTQIYFSCQNPRQIVAVPFDLSRETTIAAPFPGSPYDLIGSSLHVDSPLIYLYLSNRSFVMTYNLSTKLLLGIKFKPPLFSKITPFKFQGFIIRGFDSVRQKQFIQKISAQTGSILQQVDLIPDQQDHGYSSDGIINFDSTQDAILYVQKYQNRFFCMDTSLNLIYTGHTIDTTFTNPVKTKTFFNVNNLTKKQEGSQQAATPINIINKMSCTALGHLFVLSILEADNEENNKFLRNNIIDVYRIKNGHYVGSFYVPNIAREQIIGFTITNNLLIALYKTHIATYQLNFQKNKFAS